MKRLFSLILCAIITAFGCGKEQDDYSTIIFFIGDVKKNNAEAEIGEIIKINDIIATGLESSCDIKIGGSIIRLKEKTRITISELLREKNIENTTLGLDVGKVLCKTKKLMKNESFMIKTPTAVAGIRGTKFSVEADMKKTSRVKVFNGKVKVVKRVKQLENKIEMLMEEAPTINAEEKVIVTEKEVIETEKMVEKILAKEQASKKNIEIAIAKTIEEVKEDVVVSKEDIKVFNIEDFQEEKQEIIAVEEKPSEVINEVTKLVKLEKQKPKPKGRLLITKLEIYYIKDGKVMWQGKIIKPPLKIKDRLYIASGDQVFCASTDGLVLWKRKMENDGNIEIKKNKLFVSSKGKVKKLNPKNGMML